MGNSSQPPAEPSAGGGGSCKDRSIEQYNEGGHHLQKEAAGGAGELDRVLGPLPAGSLPTEEAGEAD